MRVLLCMVLLLVCACARADFSDAPQVPALVAALRDRAGFDAAELGRVRDALEEAQYLPQLIHTERHAKEKTLTWQEYEPIAVNPTNIARGVAFMRTQRKWLARAEADYGVPPAVVAAVLGVETKYGLDTGHVRALDALATMAFRHPTRGPFFLGELEQFFVLCRDDGFDPTQPKASYAGALGDAQFMPSSYMRLGVDFDGDGSVDLWTAPDAIGSVANYLANYDPARAWQRGVPLLVPAQAPDPLPTTVPVNGKRTDTTVAALRDSGIVPADGVALPDGLRAGVVQLEGSDGPRTWIALHNFYAVMTYNPRIFYAMAVARLAAALTAAREAGG